MARAIWTGFLSFGLVSVPVGLFPATEDRAIHFNQFERDTADRIRYRKVNERTGNEVDTSDIVRGFDLGGGEYVIVTPDELRQVAPGKSETIEISDFVDLDEIDPIYFQRSYYLAPKGKGSDRAYALLARAMNEANRVGIATFVMRDKQYLVAVRPSDDVLVLETMYFADEIRQPADELESLPGPATFQERELETAKRLIESLTVKFEPVNYHDTYRERVEELIEQKRKGHFVVTETERPKANVVNLMDALQASLDRSTDHRAGTIDAAPAESPEAKKEPEAEQRKEARGEASGLASMTKADLVRRAGELGIEGRSKMTKDQLIEAVKAITPGRRRAKKAS